MKRNQTSITSVLLMSLSDDQKTIHVLFIFFLLIYLMTVFSNFLILLLVVTCAHLHTPMYFFLGNLAFLDMSYSSVTAPTMLSHLITHHWSISLSECIAQVFFLTYFATSEAYMLASMSYDRYVAICRPLHYSQLMSWEKCTHIVSLVWVSGFLFPFMYTLFLRSLTFCGPKFIENFCCDMPRLLQITCSDTFTNSLFLLTVGSVFGSAALLTTFYPYVRIFRAVLRIGTSDGKSKAFSTCTSHLTVVTMYYVSAAFIYLVPNTKQFLAWNQVLTIMYTMITPLLNPLIYSLRSKDLKAALQRALHIHRLHPDTATRR